MSDNYNYNELT